MFVNNSQVQQQSEHQQINNPLVNELFKNPAHQKMDANDEEHIVLEIHKLQSSLELQGTSNQSESKIINESMREPKNIPSKSMFQIFQYVQKDSSDDQKLCFQPYMNLPLSSTNKLQAMTALPIQSVSYGKPEMEDYDIDLQLNDSDLPLASMTKYGNTSSFQEPSESSDDINYYAQGGSHHNFNSITFFNEKRESQDLSSSQELLNCRKCHILEQANKQLAIQVNELAKEVFILKSPKTQIKMKNKKQSCPSSTNSNDDDSSNISIETTQHLSSPQIFLQQLSEMSKIMEKIQKNDFKIKVPVTQEERELFISFESLLSKIKNLFQIRQYEGEQQKQVNKIHQKYKKLIQKLKSQHREQIDKLGEDFKKFMDLLSEKTAENKLGLPHRQTQLSKGQISRSRMRKVKTLVQKQDLPQYNLQQHSKQVIELLQINYQKQKNKVKTYERYYKKILQKHNHDVAQLIKQLNYYKETAKRYQKEFESIMLKIAKSNVRLEINSCELFKNISQRIFEISNCIPFEENDEQNLFVPENETEVYDMLQRIRRFYLQIEEFTAKKQREAFNLKKNFIVFLKDLIENDKVSIRYTIQLISRNKELGLDYIKDYINSLRKKKFYSPKKPIKAKNLSLIKTESYSYAKKEDFTQQNQL